MAMVSNPKYQNMAYDTFKNITIQQLESLVHLVAERNFSRAARKMVLTQPSLSKHIKNLEDAAGTRIVNREGSGDFAHAGRQTHV